MRIVYLYLPGRLPRIADLREKTIPTEFFYGAPELEACGHDVEYIDVHDVPTAGKAMIAAELLLKKKYLPAKVYFPVLLGVKKVLPALSGADMVVATAPGIAFSLAIWQSLGTVKLPRSFIAIHCGLFNYPQRGVRRWISRYLLRQMHTQLFGEGELEAMQERFQIPSERIQVNCFGVDECFWTPGSNEQQGDYILAVGNDSRRDYELLVQSAQHIERKIKILTKRPLPPNLPENVEQLQGSWHTREVSDADLRDLYRKAFCVAVLLTDSIQPSGQSVTLQAMACGTPVILTQTKGVWEKSELQHGKNILFTEAGNAQHFAETARMLSRDPGMRENLSKAGREYIMEHGRIGQFAERLEAVCKQVKSDE
ncbi:MAG: glycosyltransferase family 4 protein [Candidatus Electrothrix scaldis]|nr:MAG: glycosyltransferase family 4 protein [Candidatus Electrothrix sp. GW3-3]